MSAEGQPYAWLPAAAAILVLLAFLPFVRALAHAAGTNAYAGHVILVPILAAGLYWHDRHGRRGLTSRGGVSGASLTGVGLVLVGIAYRTVNVSLQALSFVVAATGLVLWFHGPRGVRQARFVLVFLLFMVPPPRDVVAAIAPSVQHCVATFSAVVLQSLHIPVEQEGVYLRLPGLTLEVAEACSGLRFLLILFMLVLAFARVALPTISGQVVLLALCIPVALLANATRVAATSVGAYVIGPHIVTGSLHYYIGKGCWALAFAAIIGLARLLRRRTPSVVVDRSPYLRRGVRTPS